MSQENEEVIEDEDEGVEVEVEVKAEAGTEIEIETEPSDSKEEKASGSEDELDSYSNKVQTRIKKLTEKYRKEERDREEAVRMAQQLLNENQNLKSRMQNLDKGYLAEYGTRLETQVASAKKLYREAHDSGDTDKMLEAQEALSNMSIENERLRLAKQRSEQAQPVQAQQPVVPQQQVPQTPAAKPDPKAEAWAEKNDWFGNDEVMTYAAFGIHRKLVEEEGIDPTANDYYSEVDKRMRVEFPHKFQAAKKSGGAQVAPAGASATRSTAKTGRRSVKLSPSQIAMAKRLNVPLEEYAKYVKD